MEERRFGPQEAEQRAGHRAGPVAAAGTRGHLPGLRCFKWRRGRHTPQCPRIPFLKSYLEKGWEGYLRMWTQVISRNHR